MSQYRAGTVTVTNGSATVIGVDTSWELYIAINDWFIVNGVIYVIGGITDDNTLTLTAPYGGATESSKAYVAHRDFAANGSPLMIEGDIETATIFNAWASNIAQGTDANSVGGYTASELAKTNEINTFTSTQYLQNTTAGIRKGTDGQIILIGDSPFLQDGANYYPIHNDGSNYTDTQIDALIAGAVDETANYNWTGAHTFGVAANATVRLTFESQATATQWGYLDASHGNSSAGGTAGFNFNFTSTEGTGLHVDGNEVWHAGNLVNPSQRNVDETYDSNKTFRGNQTFFAMSSAGSYAYQGIEIKEYQNVGSSQSADMYMPAMTFHWGGRVQRQIGLAADGHLYTSDDEWATKQKIAYTEGPFYPTLLNGWVDYNVIDYGQAKYWKVGDVVHVAGLVKDGASNDILTLPVGYRPSETRIFATFSNSLVGRLDVKADGRVTMDIGSNSWFSINCSFVAEQ